MGSDASDRADQVIATFLQRVGTGQIEDVRAMLTAVPALVNAVGPHPFWGGRPQPLHLAIEGRRRELFDLLVNLGADVNGVNDQYDHWSPLMIAIDRKEFGMRDELLKRGVRVGLGEALMLEDDTRVAELLARHGLPAITPNGGSFLAFARTVSAIDQLLGAGASRDKVDRWGSTPIDAMSRRGPAGRPLVAHMITRGVPAAPEHFARMADDETLQALVANDPSIARRDAVLMGAVDFKHHSLARWLLAQGANPNARSGAPSRHTALHSAAWGGDLKMVQLLIDAGADPSIKDDQYEATAIGWAETSIEVSNNERCEDVVKYLATL